MQRDYRSCSDCQSLHRKLQWYPTLLGSQWCFSTFQRNMQTCQSVHHRIHTQTRTHRDTSTSSTKALSTHLRLKLGLGAGLGFSYHPSLLLEHFACLEYPKGKAFYSCKHACWAFGSHLNPVLFTSLTIQQVWQTAALAIFQIKTEKVNFPEFFHLGAPNR